MERRGAGTGHRPLRSHRTSEIGRVQGLKPRTFSKNEGFLGRLWPHWGLQCWELGVNCRSRSLRVSNAKQNVQALRGGVGWGTLIVPWGPV